MRQVLIRRNYYRQTNTDRITKVVELYQCLCDVAYDPKREHKCWTEFIKSLGYELNIDILAFKEKIDKKLDWLAGHIEQGLDKNKD